MATITEKPVHGVMTPVIEMESPAEEIDFAAINFREHAHRHAADGADPLTLGMIGAVNKAGDTMNGTFDVQANGSPTAKMRTTTTASGTGYLGIVDGDIYSFLAFLATARDELYFSSNASGSHKERKVLHTGNKPSGAYTGNGSATSRTIDTGGIGAALLIIGNGVSCIVTPGGAFILAGGNVSALGADYISFSSGVLTIATNHGGLNANGIPYNYQVL